MSRRVRAAALWVRAQAAAIDAAIFKQSRLALKLKLDLRPAAAEMASEREDRIWQVGSERRQAEQEELQRGLVRAHPCA